MKTLPVGKLKMDHLSQLLKKYRGTPDNAVVVGPEIGEDAAVIEIDSTYVIAKTDPITFATDMIGEYAIQVNANDIACMGGKPRWFLATVLLPEQKTDKELIERIFSQLSRSCEKLGIAICGGHTEVTYGLDRPIVIGQMLGTIPKERLVRSSGAQPGDHILLTKSIAVEATSLLAHEKKEELTKSFDKAFIERCLGFLASPGISVVKDAEIALTAGIVHAMHDPTEGGLATGVHELCSASNIGIEIWDEKIPVFPETKRLCEFFGLDPLGVIASGSLLIAAPPDSSERIMKAHKSKGIESARIGLAKERSKGIHVIRASQKIPLPCFDQDEISKVF